MPSVQKPFEAVHGEGSGQEDDAGTEDGEPGQIFDTEASACLTPQSHRVTERSVSLQPQMCVHMSHEILSSLKLAVSTCCTVPVPVNGMHQLPPL